MGPICAREGTRTTRNARSGRTVPELEDFAERRALDFGRSGGDGTSGVKVSIVIPVRNGGAALRDCLEAAMACRPAANEVIVVDDASEDGSAETAEAAGARIVRLPRQCGPAFARNRGAEVATSDVLFFVDADVRLPSDAMAQVVAAFSEEPGIAAVFGSYDDTPAAPGLVSRYKNLLHHWVHQQSNPDATTFWAGCGALRRDVFLALGGFDESYARPSIEDIELGGRLVAGGHAIRLRKSLQAKHLKRWTAGSLLRADIRDRALPWSALLLRQGALPADLNLRWSARISGAAAPALALALLAAPWWKPARFAAGGLALLLLALNAPLYRFFRERGGLAFALGCIAWHWLYYLYSAAVFAAVAMGHRLRRARTDRADPRPPSGDRAQARAGENVDQHQRHDRRVH